MEVTLVHKQQIIGRNAINLCLNYPLQIFLLDAISLNSRVFYIIIEEPGAREEQPIYLTLTLHRKVRKPEFLN